jgi:hypothetical protein
MMRAGTCSGLWECIRGRQCGVRKERHTLVVHAMQCGEIDCEDAPRVEARHTLLWSMLLKAKVWRGTLVACGIHCLKEHACQPGGGHACKCERASPAGLCYLLQGAAQAALLHG